MLGSQAILVKPLLLTRRGRFVQCSVWHFHFCWFWFLSSRHDVFECHVEGGSRWRFQRVGSKSSVVQGHHHRSGPWHNPCSVRVSHKSAQCRNVLEFPQSEPVKVEKLQQALVVMEDTGGVAVECLKAELEKKASQKPPLNIQVDECRKWSEKRLAELDRERESELSVLTDAKARLQRLEAEQTVPMDEAPLPADWKAQMEVLQAQVTAMPWGTFHHGTMASCEPVHGTTASSFGRGVQSWTIEQATTGFAVSGFATILGW